MQSFLARHRNKREYSFGLTCCTAQYIASIKRTGGGSGSREEKRKQATDRLELGRVNDSPFIFTLSETGREMKAGEREWKEGNKFARRPNSALINCCK